MKWTAPTVKSFEEDALLAKLAAKAQSGFSDTHSDQGYSDHTDTHTDTIG